LVSLAGVVGLAGLAGLADQWARSAWFHFRSSDGLMDVCLKLFNVFVLVFFLLPVMFFYDCHAIWMSFESDSVAFWCYFGVPGGLLAIHGFPGTPLRRQSGKSSRESGFGVLPWNLVWVPNQQRVEKKSFREARWNALRAKCYTRVVSGPAQIMKTMVLFTRKQWFCQHETFDFTFPHGAQKQTKLASNEHLFGTLWNALGVALVFGRVLGTGGNFDGFWDPPWVHPRDNGRGGGG
jgi:hypothetical protein